MNTPAAAARGSRPSVLREHLLHQMPLFRRAMLFGLVANLLLLGPTVYMLQVYDRVLNSRDQTTLWMLLLIVIVGYVAMEALELIRGEIMSRAGRRLDEGLRARLFDSVFYATLSRGGIANTQTFNDLRTLREFLASPALSAFMELPAAVVFLAIVFWIHPVLGVFALVGALVQVWITVRTERQTMPALTAANKAANDAQSYASGALRSTQVIEAMGMMHSIRSRWMIIQRRFLAAQAHASDHGGTNNAIGRFVQMMQGSMLLGVACWIGIHPETAGTMSGGTMIVASILGGRALAPLVQLVTQWQLVVNVRNAYGRLSSLFDAIPLPPRTMPLPPPQGRLTVESVIAHAPGTTVPILRAVSFFARPGEMVMVIGPSAAGKTTLARLLTGVWPAAAGKVRLDGADVFAWNKEELGPHVGYLPQGVELFDGTIAENIARFGKVDLDKVREAGTMVGLDPMITELPDGYDSRVGEEGAFLSGGQRQRIALARALYGMPRFLVLDEPNSSLDEAGEHALLETLLKLKAAGRTIVAISHRSSLLPAADRILVLRDGQVAMFGARDEVLAAMQQATLANAAAQAQAAPSGAGGGPALAGSSGAPA